MTFGTIFEQEKTLGRKRLRGVISQPTAPTCLVTVSSGKDLEHMNTRIICILTRPDLQLPVEICGGYSESSA